MTTNLTAVNLNQKQKIKQKREVKMKDINEESEEMRNDKAVHFLEVQKRDRLK